MATIAMMTDSELPPTPKAAFLWVDKLRPYHAKSITQCFNWGNHFQLHFCHEVSDMQLYMLAINTT